MTYGTGHITGTYLLIGTDGVPATGQVRVIPNVPAIRDLEGNAILVGALADVTLDPAGSFTVEVPATDDSRLDPHGFAYSVVAMLDSGSLIARGVQVSEGQTVDVIDWTDVDPAPPVYTPYRPPTDGEAGSGQGVEIVQSTPSASWVLSVPAGFGRRPNVAVYIDGEQVETDVTATTTTVSIQFPAPVSGSAVLT